MQTLIATYDYDTQDLEPITTITPTTALAIAPKFCESYMVPGTYFLAGWNLYAIDGDRAVLLEAYDSQDAAEWIRDSIMGAMENGAEMVAV